jgi:hypothetical protein
MREKEHTAQSGLVAYMYQFVIDLGEENSYTLAAPEGVEATIFEKIAISS